jgi:multidrug resistance efflux pump
MMRPVPKVLLFLLVAMVVSCARPDVELHPRVEQMTESVYASVNVVPEGYYKAYSAISGILNTLAVQEGDSISKGQLIASIKADQSILGKTEAALSADLARENYNGPSNVLQNLQRELESVRMQYELDSINFYRQERLWEQSIGSKVEFESARLRYDLSGNKLSNVATELIQKKRELRTMLGQANTRLDMASTSFEDHEIRARLGGMVYSVLKEEGELVSQLDAVATIGRSDRFLVEMAIDEVDVARIQVSQKVWITLDAYEEQVFEAQVERIIPLKDERTQTFTVEAKFVQVPPVLYAGLAGEANIIIANGQEVLSIPLDYLIDGNKVLTDEGEQTVVIGMRTLDRVEIVEGIDSSTVLLSPK